MNMSWVANKPPGLFNFQLSGIRDVLRDPYMFCQGANDNDSSSSLDSKNSGEYLDRGHVSLQSARKMFEKLSQHAETQDASFEAAMQENQRLREQLRVSIEKTRAANASSLAMSSTTSNSTQQNVMLSDMFDESGDHPLESVLDGEEDGDV